MGLVALQVAVVLIMVVLTAFLYKKIAMLSVGEEEVGEAFWIIKLPPDRLDLPVGNYLVGNGMFNDIYIDTGNEPLRMYWNIQKNKVLVTVLKGKIRISDKTYKSNQKEQILIEDNTRIYVGNLQLKFLKRGGG